MVSVGFRITAEVPLRLLMFVFLMSGLWFSALVQAQVVTCPGALPSRMVVNQPGRVITANGTNLRERPTVSAELVGGMPENAQFTVIDGPVCADGFTWWEVRYTNRTGWTAESTSQDYFLESLAPLYQRFTFENVSLLVDSGISTAVRPERKNTTPVNREGGVELVTLPHIRFSLVDESGQSNISVYPVSDYNLLLGGALDSLRALLSTRPAYLDMFALPPNLPSTDIPRIVVARAGYRNFDGGTGVRFLGYFDYAADGVDDGDLFYVYLGLTDDGADFVQAFIPIRLLDSSGLSGADEITYARYLAQVQATLETARDRDFRPSLGQLDDLIDRLEVTPAEPLPVREVEYAQVRFTVSRSITASARGETVQASPASADFPLPRHTRFYFTGFPTVDNLPQIAVFPASEYNFTYVGAIDELRRIVNSGSPTPTVPQRLPIIPNKNKTVDAQPVLIEFANGRGLRFLAYFRGVGEPARPITASRIAYVFLGLTDDGQNFVQVLIPLTTTLFPETQPVDLDAAAFEETYDEYVAQVRRDLNTASAQTFTPRLDLLDELVRSLEVRPGQ
jgi:hypothetical protein